MYRWVPSLRERIFFRIYTPEYRSRYTSPPFLGEDYPPYEFHPPCKKHLKACFFLLANNIHVDILQRVKEILELSRSLCQK